jgi:hypothetical protein
MAGVVNSGGCVIKRAHERELVSVFGRARKYLADLDAVDVGLDRLVRPANFGWSVRLHVPRVQLAWAAEQHQEDAVHIFFGADRAGGFEREEIGQRKTQKSERARVQKIASPDAVAEAHGLFSVESKHRL